MIRFFRRIFLIALNVLMWGFNISAAIVFFLGALLLRLVTPPFDPNLKVLQGYTCFWSSVYLWSNPFWSLKKLGMDHVNRKKTYVIVANHQSMVDILCIFNTFLHFKWVSKKSLFKVPLIGWNMSLNGYIPIDRGNPESRERCMDLCRDWLRKGSSIFFFPEGTRSKDGRIQAFKRGAFHLALETGHDILPIVINGSHYAIPKHSRLLSGKSKMTLEILPPVSIENYRDKDREEGARLLCEEVHGVISAKVRDIPPPPTCYESTYPIQFHPQGK